MSANPSDLDLNHVSDMIGDIYDCAIDPALWPDTLDRIRNLLVCANAALYVFDLETGGNRLHTVVGIEPEWQSRMLDYDADIQAVINHVGDAMTRPLDRHFVMRRELSDDFLFSNRYFKEWAQPQGISDLIQATLMREPTRLAMLAMGRYEKDGRVSDREVRLLDLLSPHLRRAVRISDMIDMKAIRAATFEATLDEVATPVAIVTEDRTMLYANPAANALLASSSALRVGDGRLHGLDPLTTDRLAQAISSTTAGEQSHTGVVLSRDEDTLAVAHVLPISAGTARGRLAPNAAAAVFVASRELPYAPSLAAIAEAFGLTPAELRVLEHIAAGAGIAEASRLLGTGQTTTKTHLARILSKTGTRGQPDLLSLVYRLASIPLGQRVSLSS